MNFEVLKRSHVKRNILIVIAIVLVLSAVILTFTRAKYRVTQSMPLLQGTINFSPSDLDLMAVYLNKGSETISSDKVPHVGYTLNEEQSICEVNDAKDETIEISYENGLLNFNGLGNKGTKCTAYFDLIPDNENPVINSIAKLSSIDTELTITVNATDNVGVYYYYFKLDHEEEIRLEENTYTFKGLTKDQIYAVTIRVEDAAGNSDEYTENIKAGLKANDIILAQEGGIDAIIEKGTPDFSQVATTDEGMYAAQDKYGTSYYYRGAVDDNWMQFGTNSSGQLLYWRIIRINGDGTIRLIYNGTSTTTIGITTQIQRSSFNSSYNNNMYVGYMYTYNEVHGLQQSSEIKGILDTWYQNNLTSYAEYIDGNIGFCGDRAPSTNSSTSNGFGGTGLTRTYYGAHIRLYESKAPVLTCTNDSDLYTTIGSGQGNQTLTYPIGLITADEVAMAGGVSNTDNTSYYLYTGQDYWTMSPSNFNSQAGVFIVNSDGDHYGSWVTYSNGVRPVINLKANVSLTGSGTISDPFRIQF